jgi:hypothetical protein
MGDGTLFVVGSDGDILERREGTGCLRRFGIALALAGAGWMAFTLKAREAGRLDHLALSLAPGALLLALGVFCLFVRGGAHLDRRRRIQVSWWNALGFGRRRETSFAGCDRVEIGKHSGDSDSPTTYPITLAGPEGVKPLRLDAPADYQRARRSAEGVARFLSLPLHDRSAGETLVRQPAELDEPLRTRLRRTGGAPDLPPEPAVRKATVQQTNDGLRVETVGPGPTVAAWLPVVFAGAFAVIVGFTFWRGLRYSPKTFAVALGVFMALPILSALRIALRNVLQRTVVMAGHMGLRVEQAFLLGRKVTEIPADELEELILLKPGAPRLPAGSAGAEEWKWSLEHGRMPDGTEAPRLVRWAWRLARSQGLLARSDRVSVTFGAGLPPDELAYLHALLLRALV